MSSLLAMILAVGMAVPGDGPEMVSAEMEQRLDLSGEWEGTWWLPDGRRLEAYSDEDWLCAFDTEWARVPILHCLDRRRLDDEGGGKYDVSKRRDLDTEFHGIYRQDGDRLAICFCAIDHPYPTSFQAADGQHLLVLRRVRPRK